MRTSEKELKVWQSLREFAEFQEKMLNVLKTKMEREGTAANDAVDSVDEVLDEVEEKLEIINKRLMEIEEEVDAPEHDDDELDDAEDVGGRFEGGGTGGFLKE